MNEPRWRIRLGREAEEDFARIVRYSHDAFGERQAAKYKTLLIEALVLLERGPHAPGSAARDEILPGLRSFHIARRGRPGRHFVLYRASEGQLIEVLRILHDAMELGRHIPRGGE
ncbi:MAG: type II toxin-antitoxin system RelE/ParE family toxin [Rhodoblastus sp.]